MSASERLRGIRRWRRSRPFWGGLLTALAGIEIIAIPLAPTSVAIHQGIAGVASWLAGALLIVAGVLMWTQPQQRSFFGILAVLLSLLSFVTSNLGGFVFGMLLGLIGGALGFAWTPQVPAAGIRDDRDAPASGGPAAPAPGPRTGPGGPAPEREDVFVRSAPGHASGSRPYTGDGTHTRGDGTPPYADRATARRYDDGPDGGGIRPFDAGGERPPASERPYGQPARANEGRAQRHLGLTLAPALLGAALTAAPARAVDTTCDWLTSLFGCSAAPAPSPLLPGTGTTPAPKAPGKAKSTPTGKCGTSTPTAGPAKPGATPPPGGSATPTPSASASASGSGKNDSSGSGPAKPGLTLPGLGSTPGSGTASCGDCPDVRAKPGRSVRETAKLIAAAAPCAKPGKPRRAAAGQAPASTDPATLNARSLKMSDLHYDGVVELPTVSGTPVRVLRFSMSKAALDGVDQQAGRGAGRSRLRADSLVFSGNVAMYTTSLTAKLFGLLTLTFTPEHPPPLVLASMTMTQVVSEQPSVVADSATAKSLDISAAVPASRTGH